MGSNERRGEERWGEERREGSQHDNDSPPPSLDVCSSITYTVRLISVAMGTLADSIWPNPQPEGDIFLVLNNRKKPWRECVTMATSVADSGGVRGVQMHPPLAASNVFLGK